MRGLTLIELLIVISIMALLGAMTTPFLSSFLLRSNTDTTLDYVVGTLRKSQEYAMANKDNSTWGSCVDANKIRLFKGSCTSPSWSEEFTIPSEVSVSGLSSTTFNSRGEPSTARNITIQSGLKTVTVQLNAAGGISIN